MTKLILISIIIFTLFFTWLICGITELYPALAYTAGAEVESIKITQPRVLNDFKQIEGIVYAYSPSVSQTDDNPRITASGQEVREGIIANNYLKFGTRVEIDGKEYVVQDRMNPRHGKNVFDIFMESEIGAKTWGKKIKIIKIYE